MTLAERLAQHPFQGYAYSYPHKMAYRRLDPPVPLKALWPEEDRAALFLYVHIPFCEMRCGFCNLFTTANPGANQVDAYFAALERQMQVMGEILGVHRFARAAFGGGTPTFLSEDEIVRLFSLIEKHLEPVPQGAPVSFEMSPATATPEKLKLLVDLGVTRASLGVQSFLLSETKSLGRPQDPAEVTRALERMRKAGFPVLNIDLIYGAENQTLPSWRHSLECAMRHAPEEIYLYPLYVRPLTGLNKLKREPSDLRLELYRQGRDFLLDRGYRQISMRLFRQEGVLAECADGPVYCCQEDGMLGLGPGARSYTTSVHYSSEYAVGRSGVQQIIEAYSSRSRDDFAVADYGCTLNGEEQRRRFVIKSLLRCEGLDRAAYSGSFARDPLEDFPQLDELCEHRLAVLGNDRLTLTLEGMERSDTIGPWLFSEEMRSRMEEYELV